MTTPRTRSFRQKSQAPSGTKPEARADGGLGPVAVRVQGGLSYLPYWARSEAPVPLNLLHR